MYAPKGGGGGNGVDGPLNPFVIIPPPADVSLLTKLEERRLTIASKKRMRFLAM
jgi:hypothetical protein